MADWRPLEPDAGNSAEGSEVSEPDWRFSHAFRAHGSHFLDRINKMNGTSGTSDIEGKVATGSGERGGSRSSFNSGKVYVNGEIYPGIRVPFREITLAP